MIHRSLASQSSSCAKEISSTLVSIVHMLAIHSKNNLFYPEAGLRTAEIARKQQETASAEEDLEGTMLLYEP